MDCWWGKQNKKVGVLAKYYLQKCSDNKQQNVSVRLWYEHWAVC